MMTMARSLISPEEWIVVTFDFYASERLLKELEAANKMEHLIDFLNEVHGAMVRFEYEQHLGQRVIQPIKFKRYKFTGDGWVLLFPLSTSGSDISKVIQWIAYTFWSRFVKRIQDLLRRVPDQVGIRFGIDRGVLQRVKWDGKEEYVGPALMIAERLQGALKANTKHRKIGKGKDPFRSWVEVLVKQRCYELLFKSNIKDSNWIARPVRVSLDKMQKSAKSNCIKLSPKYTAVWPRFLRGHRHDISDSMYPD